MIYYFRTFWYQIGESTKKKHDKDQNRKLELLDGQKARMR